MNSDEIEIPLIRSKSYRLLEMLPATLSFGFMFLIVLLSLFLPGLAVPLLLIYSLFWVIKSLLFNFQLVQGFIFFRTNQLINWKQRLNDLDDVDKAIIWTETSLGESSSRMKQKNDRLYLEYLMNMQKNSSAPSQQSINNVLNVVIITIFNETNDIVEPTIQSLLRSNYPHKKVMLVFAYELRGGPEVEEMIERLTDKYRLHFKDVVRYGHPEDIENEVKGKGPNLTWTGKQLENYMKKHSIDLKNVLVTTLDADNRPSKNYLSNATFMFLVSSRPHNTAFQPTAIFNNNIWDVPTIMRLIAVGNSFWNFVVSVRPHLLRNFSAHSQSLYSLKQTNYWSVRTVVEDGHQFWRSYFALDGDYEVTQIYSPIYQDAVLGKNLKRTVVAQFKQIRRWAYGCSDIPYVITMSFRAKKIGFFDKTAKTIRLVESHFTWATAAPILAFSAWLPLLLSDQANQSILVHQLPIIVSRLQTVATLGLVVAMLLTLLSLPPRPIRYGTVRSIATVLQWIILPISSLAFGMLAVMYSQIRLFRGKYMGEFDVTEKAVK